MWKNSTHLAISAKMWFEEVRCVWTTPYKCLSTLHILLPLYRCTSGRFGRVEQPQIHVKELYTPCYLCINVVRVGSWRFDALELVHKHPAHLASPIKMNLEKVWYSWTNPNWSERTLPLSVSAMMWFEKVQGGLMAWTTYIAKVQLTDLSIIASTSSMRSRKIWRKTTLLYAWQSAEWNS